MEEVNERLQSRDNLVSCLGGELEFTKKLLSEERESLNIVHNRIQEFAGLKAREFPNEIKRDNSKDPEPVKVGRSYPSRHETISLLTKRSEKLAEEARKREAEAVSSGLLAPEKQEVILK